MSREALAETLLQELAAEEQAVADALAEAEAAEHRRDVLKQAVDVLREGGLIDPATPALPAPSGKPEEGVKREREPAKATVPQPPQPTNGKRAAHTGRHTFRNGACIRDGCDKKGTRDAYSAAGREGAKKRSGRARGSASSPSDEGAKQEPRLRAGEVERDGKVFHALQPDHGIGSPCPLCKAFPVEAAETRSGHGQRMYCPGPECDWRQFRLPDEEEA